MLRCPLCNHSELLNNLPNCLWFQLLAQSGNEWCNSLCLSHHLTQSQNHVGSFSLFSLKGHWLINTYVSSLPILHFALHTHPILPYNTSWSIISCCSDGLLISLSYTTNDFTSLLAELGGWGGWVGGRGVWVGPWASSGWWVWLCWRPPAHSLPQVTLTSPSASTGPCKS